MQRLNAYHATLNSYVAAVSLIHCVMAQIYQIWKLNMLLDFLTENLCLNKDKVLLL
jgi:hypothetical protein